jgi:hypothetical protein
MNFEDLFIEERRIPFSKAASWLLELRRPTEPPPEPTKTAEVQLGMLKIAAAELIHGEGAPQIAADQALTDPNVQAALEFQQAKAEREHFAAQAQEAEERAAAAEQQAQEATQQAQQAQMAADQANQEVQMQAQEKEQAMTEAIQVRDQSLQEQLLASRKREELVGMAEDLKAQVDELAATTEQQTEALRMGIEQHQDNVEQAMAEEAQQGQAPKGAQKQQQEADQAAVEAEQQQANQAAQAPAQAPAPPQVQMPGAQQQGQIPGAPKAPSPVAKTASLAKDVIRYARQNPGKTTAIAAAPFVPGAVLTGAVLANKETRRALKMNVKKPEIDAAVNLYQAEGHTGKMSGKELNDYIVRVRKQKTAAGGVETKSGRPNQVEPVPQGSRREKAA